MNRLYWMKQSRQENITYLVVWGLLFASPLLSLYVRTINDANLTFDWTEVFLVWRKFAVYLLLFLVHNFFVAPLLIHKHKRMLYFSAVTVVLVAFAVYQYSSRPSSREPMGLRPPMEQFDRHDPPPMPADEPIPNLFDEPDGPPHFDEPNEPPMAFEGQRPPHEKHEMRRHDPPPIVGERDILAIVMLILMFGANLGIKGYYNSREDRRRLAALEKKNLEQQLEYLRYQINPHFFMNTLNNIHALVDIDPEKAKDTILELSKMMRFVLYEGNKQGVPLSRELDFIRHYIALMQLRYTDKVRITLDLPQEVPDSQIQPLILITFIENAFKHGVSYQRDSFIEVQMAVEGDELRFMCRNSKADVSNEQKGGVGLVNVRKRLDLLYGNNYALRINDVADIYTVELTLPLKL